MLSATKSLYRFPLRMKNRMNTYSNGSLFFIRYGTNSLAHIFDTSTQGSDQRLVLTHPVYSIFFIAHSCRDHGD